VQGADQVVLQVQSRGTSRHRHGRRQAELSPGDIVISSAADGYTIDYARHEMLVVQCPRAALAERIPRLDDLLMTRLSGASSSGRIFHDFLLSLWRHGADDGQEDGWQEGITDSFYDLAALAIRGAALGRSDAPGGALRAKVVALIEARLRDPDLRTGAIADALRISPRTLQNVFAAMGTTPSLYVLERRLRHAGDLLLADPSASVTAVAFDLGFNDSAYFARCFRRYYRTTPTAWRSRH
jgi:AraC-like DNA-binding protein